MADPIIRTEGLTKRYGSVTAVRELNLEIFQGEVFGLLGPNGAGKTTTTLMLLGLTEPTAGIASIAGHDCTREPIAVKRMVGYLPDSVGFYPELTGRENLRFTGQLNGLDPSLCEQRASELLDRVGMTAAADRKTGGYSRGMKQRLGIADVLMKDPRVIIMDEPTLGIDPEGMRELIALIRVLSVTGRPHHLISSHQLYQVQQICDRVGIFVQGSLIACGRIEELGRQLESEGHYTWSSWRTPAVSSCWSSSPPSPVSRRWSGMPPGWCASRPTGTVRRAVTSLLWRRAVRCCSCARRAAIWGTRSTKNTLKRQVTAMTRALALKNAAR
jgi:ABC-2 type transport system ATP-binding protein